MVIRTMLIIGLMVWVAMIIAALSGCTAPSRVEIPIPGDGVQIITGEAADDYVRGLVENAKTAKARINEMFAELSKILPTLIFILIGGLVFWGFTRSRSGWIIPASVIGGIVFIVAFARWAEWIAGGVILLALAVLVWKAIEYKKERDCKDQ